MLKNSELYQPSLENGGKETKSYDIDRLFLVAFFGGTIPMMILGTRNAKWLNVPKRTIHLLLAMGILFTIVQLGISIFTIQSDFSKGTIQMLKYGVRALGIILFLMYRMILKKPFQQHTVMNGEMVPLLKPALQWIFVGAIIYILFMIPAWLFAIGG